MTLASPTHIVAARSLRTLDAPPAASPQANIESAGPTPTARTRAEWIWGLDRAGSTGLERSAEDVLEFVQFVARRVTHRHGSAVPFDDLVAYGAVGYLDAAQRYEPDRGCTLEQFAYRRVQGAMVDAVRRWSQRRASRYMEQRRIERMQVDSGGQELPDGEQRLRAVIPVPYQRVEEFVGGDSETSNWMLDTEEGHYAAARRTRQACVHTLLGPKIMEVIQGFSAKDRELLRLLYAEELTMEEVGQALGHGKSWVSRRHGRLLAKIRLRVG